MQHFALSRILVSALAASAFLLNALPAFAQDTLYDIKVTNIEGAEASLRPYEGKVLLIVNTASRCGFTPQYEGLEKLWSEYRERGLVVLGFPCNDFGAQEPGTDEQIAQFCTTQYQVSFPLFSKLHVKGPQQHALYKALTTGATNPKVKAEVPWNFSKFLVDRRGKVAAFYPPTVTPADAKLRLAIEDELAKSDAGAGGIATEGFFVLDQGSKYVYDFSQEGREAQEGDLATREVKDGGPTKLNGALVNSYAVEENGPGYRFVQSFVEKNGVLVTNLQMQFEPRWGWAVVMNQKIEREPLPEALPGRLTQAVPVTSAEWLANAAPKQREGPEVLVQRTITLLATEGVKTPSGDYQGALKVKTRIEARLKDGGGRESTFEETAWYVKGVGSVKIERTITLYEGESERVLPKVSLVLREIVPVERAAPR